MKPVEVYEVGPQMATYFFQFPFLPRDGNGENGLYMLRICYFQIRPELFFFE